MSLFEVASAREGNVFHFVLYLQWLKEIVSFVDPVTRVHSEHGLFSSLRDIKSARMVCDALSDGVCYFRLILTITSNSDYGFTAVNNAQLFRSVEVMKQHKKKDGAVGGDMMQRRRFLHAVYDALCQIIESRCSQYSVQNVETQNVSGIPAIPQFESVFCGNFDANYHMLFLMFHAVVVRDRLSLWSPMLQWYTRVAHSFFHHNVSKNSWSPKLDELDRILPTSSRFYPSCTPTGQISPPLNLQVCFGSCVLWILAVYCTLDSDIDICNVIPEPSNRDEQLINAAFAWSLFQAVGVLNCFRGGTCLSLNDFLDYTSKSSHFLFLQSFVIFQARSSLPLRKGPVGGVLLLQEVPLRPSPEAPSPTAGRSISDAKNDIAKPRGCRHSFSITKEFSRSSTLLKRREVTASGTPKLLQEDAKCGASPLSYHCKVLTSSGNLEKGKMILVDMTVLVGETLSFLVRSGGQAYQICWASVRRVEEDRCHSTVLSLDLCDATSAPPPYELQKRCKMPIFFSSVDERARCAGEISPMMNQ